MKTKATKVRVMWPDKHGRLEWRTAWRVGDNPPQATRKLAEAWAEPSDEDCADEEAGNLESKPLPFFTGEP